MIRGLLLETAGEKAVLLLSAGPIPPIGQAILESIMTDRIRTVRPKPPSCLKSHPECGACQATGNGPRDGKCIVCDGFGYLLCVACLAFITADNAYNETLTVEERAAESRAWLAELGVTLEEVPPLLRKSPRESPMAKDSDELDTDDLELRLRHLYQKLTSLGVRTSTFPRADVETLIEAIKAWREGVHALKVGTDLHGNVLRDAITRYNRGHKLLCIMIGADEPRAVNYDLSGPAPTRRQLPERPRGDED